MLVKVKFVEYGEQAKVKIVQDIRLCFITTACIEARGLPYNCPELNTVREFRDSYIKGLPYSDDIIREYYEVALQIVAVINRSENRKDIYLNLYEQLLSTVELILQGKNYEAIRNHFRIFN